MNTTSSLKTRNNKVGIANKLSSGTYFHITDAGLCQLSQYLLAFLILSFASFAVYSVAYPSSSSLAPKASSSPETSIMNYLELRSQSYPDQHAIKYAFVEIANNDQSTTQWLTYEKVLEKLSDGDEKLLKLLNEAIVSPGYGAVFWECRPITRKDMASSTFEFVVIESPALASRTVDGSSFAGKFKEQEAQSESAISFQNLGRDATLIVPSPPAASGGWKSLFSGSSSLPQYMTHLASFLRDATAEHKLQFWMLVGEQMQHTLHRATNMEQPFWLSTSGLGVSWLHVRIDNFPKYYNWQEYK